MRVSKRFADAVAGRAGGRRHGVGARRERNRRSGGGRSASPCRSAVTVEVPEKPVAKERPRNDTRGARTRLYTPDDTARYQRSVEEAGRMAMRGMGDPMDGPVAADVTVAVTPPRSWSRRRRERAVRGGVRPTVKPDEDNYSKVLYDALNGVVYVDDAQIVEKTYRKVYAERPGVRMIFTPIDAEPAYRSR